MSDIKSQLLAISDSSEWEEHPFGKVAFQGAAEIARLRSAFSTAREEGRRDGLEEADKAIASRNNDMKAAIEEAGGKASLADEAFMEGREDALSVIRALKEKQP